MRRLVILIALHTLISYCTAKKEGSTKKRIAFGEANPPSTHVPVIEAEQSISCKKFFLDYVKPQQVVLFRGAIKHSRAFTHWTDDYFLSLKDIPADHMVLVEHGKKENRDSPAESMTFQEFVRIYNHTDQYMVNGVPPFLRYINDAFHSLLLVNELWRHFCSLIYAPTVNYDKTDFIDIIITIK